MVFKHQPLVLVCGCDAGWRQCAYIIVPKGLAATEHGLITGVTDTAQSISFTGDGEGNGSSRRWWPKGPGRVGWRLCGRGDGQRHPSTPASLYIQSQSRGTSGRPARARSFDRLREATKNVQGISLVMQACRRCRSQAG